MNSPFKNDMFALVWKAFKNLYPNKDCVCMWADEIEPAPDGKQGYATTVFCDDGEIQVTVDAKLPVVNAVEVFTHELAHVAVGIIGDGSDQSERTYHGKEWEDAFDAIFKEYDRICDELFPPDKYEKRTAV